MKAKVKKLTEKEFDEIYNNSKYLEEDSSSVTYVEYISKVERYFGKIINVVPYRYFYRSVDDNIGWYKEELIFERQIKLRLLNEI
jgi:hypothetical protein